MKSTQVLRLGGVASIVTAITTFLLWYLPTTYQVAEGFEGTLALHAEPAYLARLWVNFIHVFIALFAYGCVALAVRNKAPNWAIAGFIAFAFWCLVESVGVSINIWAVNNSWRAGFLAADEVQQSIIRASLHTFAGIWDGIFFVVLVTFLIATICYGVALWHGDLLTKVLSVLFLLAAPLTVIIMLDSYFGANLSPWISWSYPILQPLSRALMGVWLFKIASQNRPVMIS